jgi:hypothetical protein
MYIFIYGLFDEEYSSVGVYGLDGRDSNPDKDKIFSSPRRSDRLWSPPSLLSIGYRRLFPCGYSGRSAKLTTHHHLMQRSRMVELYLHSPICLHGILLN